MLALPSISKVLNRWSTAVGRYPREGTPLEGPEHSATMGLSPKEHRALIPHLLEKPLSILGGSFGVVAAVLWFLAAKTQPTKPESVIIDGGDFDNPSSGGFFYDDAFMSRSKAATRFNAWAAVTTGVSVLFSTAGSLFNL